MNPEQPTQPTEQPAPQPVAYDAQGRPLYAHPPQTPPEAITPPVQVVHTARPIEPMKQEVSPQARERHERSKRIFPFLNLSEGEYVIRAVRRHPIGLVIPLGLGALVIAIIFTVMFNYGSIAENVGLFGPAADPANIILPGLLLTVIIALMMFVVYYVYVNNKFFLTNESVVQEIQTTLFSRHEQTVSLASIEDASFVQSGIVANLFNYGSIRLSTEGEETTYRFTFVANPKEHIAVLNNAVEAFKNGRPVGDD